MGTGVPVVTVDSLLLQAKALSNAERATLAERLYDSLPPVPELPVAWQNEHDAETAWQDELQQRLDEVANGTAELVPWDEALNHMRECVRRLQQS